MMKNKKRNFLLIWILALALLLNVLTFVPVVAEGEDEFLEDCLDGLDVLIFNGQVQVSEEPVNFENLGYWITQGGTSIDNETTITTDDINIKFTFRVPMAHEDIDGYEGERFKGGECVYFELSNGFKVSGDTAVLDLDGVEIGEISYHYDEEKGVSYAKIAFADKGKGVFETDPVDGSYINVWASFDATLTYDDKVLGDDINERSVKILGKEVTVTGLAAKYVYDVEKTGALNTEDQTIDWTVTITATKDGDDISLEGYTFSDDLTGVGDYVTGSFKVDGTLPTPDYGENKVLSYTFPAETMSPVTVTFSTKIDKDSFDENYEIIGTNKAELTKDDDVKGDGKYDFDFEPTWIVKSLDTVEKGEIDSGMYNPADTTITWKITANHLGASLKNVVIKDYLPEGLVLDSASYRLWNGTNWDPLLISDGTPFDDWTEVTGNGDRYYAFAFPTLDKKIELTIIAKVTDTKPAWEEVTYTNSASIEWGTEGNDGWDGGSSSGVGVPIGVDSIIKSGKRLKNVNNHGENDKTIVDAGVEWTVNINALGVEYKNLVAYDLIVHGAPDFTWNSDTMTIVDSSDNGIIINSNVLSTLKPRYNQKYIEGSFKPTHENSEDFTWAVYQVKQDGEVIADLLVVTLNKVEGTTEDSKQYKQTSFTFRTLVLDPTIYAGNESKYVRNTASLFGNNSLKKHADAWVEFTSNILEKKMLKRETANFNETANATEGFDYVNKTAIFRILVNKDGLKLSEMEINGSDEVNKVGAVTLHDTLPVGWVFVDYDTEQSVNSANSEFKIHLYEADTNGNIIANDNPEATATVITAGSSTASAVAEYTFNSLDKSYVVLIKAKLTDEQYKKELIDNKSTTTFTNKAQLFYNGTKLTNEKSQNITVNSQILDKKGTLDNGGFITWTVDYNPYGIEVSDPVFIVDELPPIISPPIGSDGKLLIDEDGTTYISITSFELKEDGERSAPGSTIDVKVGTVEYDEGGEVKGVNDGNVAYDPVTGFLVFDIEDAKVAYRFTYTTEITGGKAGDEITNKVSLYGVEGKEITSDKEFSVSESHVNAGFMRAGRIVIKKTDAKGVSIDAPATFTLYTADGSTVRWQGKTVGGSVAIGGLRPGNYILEETTAPEDYTASDIKYYIEISKSGDSFSYKFYTFTEDVNDKVEIADPAFGNQLSVVNYQAGTANLIVSKELGDEYGDPNKEFTFEFTLTGGGATAGTSYTYFRSDSPTVGVEVTSGGTFTLKPGESIMIVGLPGGATYKITEIEENEGDNAGYTAEDKYLSEDISVDEGTTKEYKANFINTYSATGSWSPKATKDFSGGTLTLENRNFTFKLVPIGEAPMPKDSDGDVVDTVYNESDGTIVFPQITFTHEDLDWEVGDGEPAHAEFKYEVSEVRPDDPEEGMEYDKTVYIITVKAEDDGRGKLDFTATYEAEEGTGVFDDENGTPIFTNIYEASGTWSPTVTKQLFGRGLRNNEFQFEMTQVEGTEVTPPVDVTWPLTARNSGSGVSFGPITFNENHIGKRFEFIIREVIPTSPEGGMRYDENQYLVKVTVSDARDGNLAFETEYYLYNEDANAGQEGQDPVPLTGITFRNIYSAGNAWTPNVTKELVGRELKDKEFEFVLKGPQGNVIEKVKNDADGNVVFSSIGFSEADIGGSYTYTIEEVVGSEPGMSYDTRSIKITVSISDAGGGVLNINASYPAVTTFVNRYSGPSGITVTANKVWKDLPSGWTEHLPTIWFKLYRSVEGKTAEAVPGLALQKLPAGVTQVSWNGLEKYDPDGKLYVYSVQEVDENGKDYEPKYFEKTEKGLTVTNAFNKERVEGDEDFETEIDVTGHKVWKGVPKGQTVPTIWLKLYRHIEGGTPVAVPGRPIMELRPGVTQGTWKDLEKVDEDYNYYIYTVKEVDSKGNDYEPPHFRKTEEGLTVTNTHTAGAPVTGETLSVYTIMGAMLMALAALFLILTRRKRAKAK